MDQTITPIDCACVIHSDGYDWDYVERLYNMLSRHITPGIRFHVYTEADRPVPDKFIKHELDDWKIAGRKRSWWYKMQLFNTEHHRGPLLYFDLDTVITSNIDWIWQASPGYLWAVRDFKHLWKPNFQGINSSVMWWDTTKYEHIWKNFKQQDLDRIILDYHGDQDYITDMIPIHNRRFFDTHRVKSWRWQCLDGGYDFVKRQHLTPSAGTQIPPSTSILVFHGNPKPAQIADPVVQHHWQ